MSQSEAYEHWIEFPAMLDVVVGLLLFLIVIASLTIIVVVGDRSRKGEASARTRGAIELLVPLPALLGCLAVLLGTFTLAFGMDVWMVSVEMQQYDGSWDQVGNYWEGMRSGGRLFFWASIACATGLGGTWIGGAYARRTFARLSSGDRT